MGQRCDCGMATPSLTWCPVFLLEVGSISSLSLLSGISSKVPSYESWESLTSQVSGALWGDPPTSYFLRLPVYILSAGPQGFSPFLSPNTRFPSPHNLPQVLPTLPTCECFLLSPSGTEASSLGHFSLLSFLSSVDSVLAILYIFVLYFIVCLFDCLFMANIHLLVSTYQACPFGSFHSGWNFLVPYICLQNSGCPCSS